jgi:uncharacterized protein YndB with AHSA1/START domain
MPTVSTSVVVPRPADEVFEFLADARNLALWSSGVAGVCPDVVPPGERTEYRYHFPGRHREHRLVCAVYQPCRRIAFRGNRMWSPLGTQVPEYGFQLLPLSRGTLVHLTVICSLNGALLLFSPLIAMAWRRDLPVDAGRLRETLCGPAAALEPAAAPAPSVAPLDAVDGYNLAPARTPGVIRAGIG